MNCAVMGFGRTRMAEGHSFTEFCRMYWIHHCDHCATNASGAYYPDRGRKMMMCTRCNDEVGKDG